MYTLLCYAKVDEWPDVVFWLDKMTPGWSFVADHHTDTAVRDRIFDPQDRATKRSRYTGYGLCIKFEDRKQMMLCKLAWGGKDFS